MPPPEIFTGSPQIEHDSDQECSYNSPFILINTKHIKQYQEDKISNSQYKTPGDKPLSFFYKDLWWKNLKGEWEAIDFKRL